MKLNLGCGKMLFSVSEGWVNVDRLSLPGVDKVVDLMQYPWPFETSSVEKIWASHLIEHIPHQSRLSDIAYTCGLPVDYVHWLRDNDGFFAFFAECWRVLIPGGMVECVAPFGMSRGAMQDPTHQRFIVETTINYLTERPHEGGTFDYSLPFTFEMVGGGFRLGFNSECGALINAGLKDAVERRMMELWNQAAEIGFTLKAVKDAE